MPKFFVQKNQINDNEIVMSDEDASHIIKALRGQIDDEIIIGDGDNIDYYCKISYIDKKIVKCNIIDKKVSTTEPNLKVTLFQAMPKGSKIELIIEKNIELGVNKIVPVMTKYVDYRQDNFVKKLIRYEKIAESAAKQSMRGIIPKISDIQTFQEVYKSINDFDAFFVCYENEKSDNLKNILDNVLQDKKNIGVFVGPEGGFHQDEIDEIIKQGGISISLGNRILRTETAGIMLTSILMFHSEDF